MAMARARLAFFLDVDDFTARRELSIATDHTSAAECREPEESDETHDVLRRLFGAIAVPRSGVILSAFFHCGTDGGLAHLIQFFGEGSISVRTAVRAAALRTAQSVLDDVTIARIFFAVREALAVFRRK